MVSSLHNGCAVSYTHLDVYKRQDKGNTTVIIPTDNLHKKVQDFIEQNNITELKYDPTDIY